MSNIQNEIEILPKELLKLDAIESINLSGKGGMEEELKALLPDATRSNSRLYDYKIDVSDRKLKIEIKKQANLQWFDIGKYHQLSEQERSIIMLFINYNHQSGRINLIAAISLGCFIDLLTSNPMHQAHGWTEEVIGIASGLKEKHRSLQFKAEVRIRNLVRDHVDRFQILFDRTGEFSKHSASESEATQELDSVASSSTLREFRIKGPRGAEARVNVTAERVVVVLKGAFAANEVRSLPESAKVRRARLVQDGALVSPGQGKPYRFERDVPFPTPSSAACVVLGRSANGRIELVDADGRTLKSLDESS